MVLNGVSAGDEEGGRTVSGLWAGGGLGMCEGGGDVSVWLAVRVVMSVAVLFVRMACRPWKKSVRV